MLIDVGRSASPLVYLLSWGALLLLAGSLLAGNHGVRADLHSEFVKGKICIGTNGRMSVPSNKQHHYRNLRDRYSNCTYVDGNLEITWLQNEDYDLSFLQYIREVTGYVLISHVDVKKIELPRLQIIRGRTLFKINVDDDEYALFVTMCLSFSLEMPALRDILNGSVGMFDNFNLCHIRTINWDEIITGANRTYNYVYKFESPERTCSPCHKSCEAGCWGEGPENCQRFSKTNCSPQCWQGRCFGPKPRECCHLFCAGGCTGPKQSDCLACKNFYDDGLCTQECPPMQKYNPTTYSWEPNPDGKYAYGATCVRKCPEHLLKDNGACVRSCPPKKKAHHGECVPCEGPCPKTCAGVADLHSKNIDDFKDCTILEGSLTILEQTFTGYQHINSDFSFGPRYDPMHPDKLEVFSTLKEITGYLNIQGYNKDFKNLSYFRNLEVIGGRTLTEYFASLYIVKTSLESLELSSLRRINSGSVVILENKHLCYANTINWDKIRKSPEHESLLQTNRKDLECAKEGSVCDEQCSKNGCWGPGADQCLDCKNFILDNICIENCSAPGIYEADNRTCKRCHKECSASCSGPNAEHCKACKNVRDGPFCVPECPISKYNDAGFCKPCHKNCVGGCTGPENNIGPRGCKSCEKAILSGGHIPQGCLDKNEPCPKGHYIETVSHSEQGTLKPLAGKTVCRKCHPFCDRCTGLGTHVQVCQECNKFWRNQNCESECPVDHYIKKDTRNCIPCSPECKGCRGPGPMDCIACRNYKIFLDEEDEIPGNSTKFNCTETCPPEYPHQGFESEPYCSKDPIPFPATGQEIKPVYLAGITLFGVLIILVFLFFICHMRLRVKAKEDTVKMTMALTGLDDNEPLRPTGAKPNLAKLRIIKEEEMRKGGQLGSGAFGNVYKGVWVIEDKRIPVAIKVLHKSTGANTSKDFLDEAYVMASLDHPHLLKLLAVCMTNQMMLVTQLMPLGCLLEFVRKQKDKIGSKIMLNWCTQIAKGMQYLEEHRLVHRDLAARNVLVQNPNCVKITDFGLAKYLNPNEDEYKAEGGIMPIKWLALECIQHRIFTHKSDVWAYGVTVWEVFTYGGKPYENVPARNVPDVLERGERLTQPPICSIDVFMLMVKCWMLDAESRPSFKELADEFGKMSQDPGRFLAIPGDKYMTLSPYRGGHENHEAVEMRAEAENSVAREAYLRPRSRAPVINDNLLTGQTLNSRQEGSDNSCSSPLKTTFPNGNPLAADSPTPQNQQNWDREMSRYGGSLRNGSIPHHNTMGSLRLQHQYPSSFGNACTLPAPDGKMRYCLDPVKMQSLRDCDVTDDGIVPDIHVQQHLQTGTLEKNRPRDDEDYLMPSPQLVQAKTQYMDLIGDAIASESEPSRLNTVYRKYPDFLTIATKHSLDNPEYLMSQDDGPLTPQPLGIPTPDSDKGFPNGTFGFPPVKRSSEEESDHEYYNDFDRLDRELQPLKPFRKTETTV